MRKIALILFIIVTLSSCGSTKNKRVVTRKSQTTKTVKKSNKPTTTAKPSIVESIIKNAEKI